MTIAELKAKLQLRLRDTADNKWTSQEKDEYLLEVVDYDPILSYEKTDTSLTASTSTQSYTLPATIDNIKKILVTVGTKTVELDKSSWKEEAGTIYFEDCPAYSGTMTLIGRGQYDNDDTIPAKYTNYIIAASIVKAYEDLMVKYQSGILMSDVTQAEILTALNHWEQKRTEEERKLDNKTMVSY
jgi:hypothetical protein